MNSASLAIDRAESIIKITTLKTFQITRKPVEDVERHKTLR
jgi:hypothetical protein